MQFSQVIGHGALKDKLTQAARQGRISHAQLFAGADGRGTLALAAAYAQYLNCANASDTDSCGECPSCRKYQLLQQPDLHFAFPAASDSKNAPMNVYAKDWKDFFSSNHYPALPEWYQKIKMDNQQGWIRVSDAEHIIHTLQFKAYEGRFKVLIMWHAEQMNIQAANKLLKIIEEPPDNTILLFVTPQPDTLLKTILSRTQQIAVPPVAPEAIAEHLTAKKRIDSDRALSYARLSNGDCIEAMRRAEQNDAEEWFFNKFVQLMRLCYLHSPEDVIAIIFWGEETAKKLGREEQKAFLRFALDILRETFAMAQKADEAVFLDSRRKEWCTKFMPYIHANNISPMYAEINLAAAHIAANGNSRIILTDMGLQLMKKMHIAPPSQQSSIHP